MSPWVAEVAHRRPGRSALEYLSAGGARLLGVQNFQSAAVGIAVLAALVIAATGRRPEAHESCEQL